MESKKVYLRGTKEDIQALKEILEAEFPDVDFQLGDSQIVKSNPLDRHPHRQIELFDIVLAIGINLASSAIYDAIKMYIANMKELDVEIVSTDESSDEVNED